MTSPAIPYAGPNFDAAIAAGEAAAESLSATLLRVYLWVPPPLRAALVAPFLDQLLPHHRTQFLTSTLLGVAQGRSDGATAPAVLLDPQVRPKPKSPTDCTVAVIPPPPLGASSPQARAWKYKIASRVADLSKKYKNSPSRSSRVSAAGCLLSAVAHCRADIERIEKAYIKPLEAAVGLARTNLVSRLTSEVEAPALLEIRAAIREEIPWDQMADLPGVNMSPICDPSLTEWTLACAILARAGDPVAQGLDTNDMTELAAYSKSWIGAWLSMDEAAQKAAALGSRMAAAPQDDVVRAFVAATEAIQSASFALDVGNREDRKGWNRVGLIVAAQDALDRASQLASTVARIIGKDTVRLQALQPEIRAAVEARLPREVVRNVAAAAPSPPSSEIEDDNKLSLSQIMGKFSDIGILCILGFIIFCTCLFCYNHIREWKYQFIDRMELSCPQTPMYSSLDNARAGRDSVGVWRGQTWSPVKAVYETENIYVVQSINLEPLFVPTVAGCKLRPQQ